MESVVLWSALGFTALVAVALLARDLRFVIGPRRRAEGVVVGHERLHEDGSVVHTAVFAFTDHRGQDHQVVDTILAARRRPPVATRLMLVYPEAKPGLARVPRPLLRLMIYLVVGYLLGILVARIAGWVD